MRIHFALCFFLLAINFGTFANCKPVDDDDDLLQNDDFSSITSTGADAAQDPKHQRLIDSAKDLLNKLNSDGKTADANKLFNAIQCTLDRLRAAAAINTSRDMMWNVQGIQNSLKSAEDKLVQMIHDIKCANHYN